LEEIGYPGFAKSVTDEVGAAKQQCPNTNGLERQEMAWSDRQRRKEGQNFFCCLIAARLAAACLLNLAEAAAGVSRSMVAIDS